MVEATIMRSEAIKELNKGLPFDLAFITADQRRGTGGDYIEVKKWLKLREDLPADKQPTWYKKEFEAKKDKLNHQHKTILVFNPANRGTHPIPVHYRLMTRLNGMRIING